MPRYFFNVHDTPPTLDHYGEDLPDDEAAWREATGFAGALFKDIDGKFRPGQEWSVQVPDEAKKPTIPDLHQHEVEEVARQHFCGCVRLVTAARRPGGIFLRYLAGPECLGTKALSAASLTMPPYYFDLVDSTTVADQGGQLLADDALATEWPNGWPPKSWTRVRSCAERATRSS